MPPTPHPTPADFLPTAPNIPNGPIDKETPEYKVFRATDRETP
jgi:hypothetical protein